MSSNNSQRTSTAPDTGAANDTGNTSPARTSAAAATDFDDSDVTIRPDRLAASSRPDDPTPAARLDLSSLHEFPPPPPPSTKVPAAAGGMNEAEANLASPATDEAVAGSQDEPLVASKIDATMPSAPSPPAGIYRHPYDGDRAGVPFLPVPGIGFSPAQGTSMPGGALLPPGFIQAAPGFIQSPPPPFMAASAGITGHRTPGLHNPLTGLPYQMSNASFGMSPSFLSPPALSRTPSTTPMSAADAQDYADNLNIATIGQELRAILTQQIWPTHWLHDTIAPQLDALAKKANDAHGPYAALAYDILALMRMQTREQQCLAGRHHEERQALRQENAQLNMMLAQAQGLADHHAQQAFAAYAHRDDIAREAQHREEASDDIITGLQARCSAAETAAERLQAYIAQRASAACDEDHADCDETIAKTKSSAAELSGSLATATGPVGVLADIIDPSIQTCIDVNADAIDATSSQQGLPISDALTERDLQNLTAKIGPAVAKLDKKNEVSQETLIMLCHTIVTELAPRRAILLYALTSDSIPAAKDTWLTL